MSHPLVDQLKFTRSEWRRGLEGVTEEDALKQIPPMNCISWIIGHLAWHEHLYWLVRPQNRVTAPELNDIVATFGPATTPPLGEMWAAWEAVTQEVEPFLNGLTTESLNTHLEYRGKIGSQSLGTMLQRVIYHYWYHIGEIQAIRQMLGHIELPQFVGDIASQAPYRSEG